MDVAIRCTRPGCGCECFTPGKGGHRLCGTCQHGWVAHALDKLCDPRRAAMVVAVGGSGSGGEPVQPSSAFDMASLVLYGSQAVPVRLKILLDRLLSVLPHDDVIRVLHGFGWTYEDYVRGYILQDTHGTVLERWNLASRDEEPIIIQQFLRFTETRPLAHHFLTSDAAPLGSPVAADGPPGLPDSDIKKFLERSSGRGTAVPAVVAAAAAAAAAAKPGPLSLFGGKFSSSGGDSTPSLLASRGVMTVNRVPPLRHHHHHHHPPSSVSSGQSASPPAVGCSPAASPLTALSSSSPLNKLQSMQPYDFRQGDRRATSPGAAAGGCVTESARSAEASLMQSHHHHSHSHHHHHNNNNNNNSSSPKTPLSSPTHNHNSFSAPFPNNSSDLSLSEGLSDDETGDAGAINLSLGVGSMDSVYAARKVKHLRKSANPMKRRWNPMVLSTLTTNPATGKRRVQCHVCLKTFCDKGALKIHFSAVHLREMHKCTVEGCNMMFSSRRSRNRHSANPNPKLHTPNLRRKISPHDGRTANPFPLLPPSTLLGFNNANASSIVPPSSLASALHDKLGAVQEKLASLCSTQAMLGSGGPLSGDCSALRLTTRKSRHDERQSLGEHLSDDRSPRRRDGVNLSSVEKGDKDAESSRPSVAVLSENKGVRKRKALNPTKCAAVTSDDDLQYATSDESSSNTYIDHNGLMEESKSDDDMDDVDDISTDGQDDSKDFDIDDDLDDKDTDGRMTPSPPPIKFKTEREVPPWNFEVEQGKIGGVVAIKKEDEKPVPSSNNEPRASPVLTQRHSSVEDLSTKKDGEERTSPGASVKTEDMAENPLRHLESLSLGAFASLVPTAPRSLSSGGVSFHAPGLGLADVPRDMHEPCLRDSSPPSSDQHMSSLLPVYRDAALVGPGLEIPVDKENPRRCTACGKVFQNHFGVKTHYQNVHLKLMHKCTVEGCNAAFPSKRSRDRHSANLNLHRKLLSTSSSEKGGASPFLDKALFPYPPSDFFTRLYDPQGLPLNLADVYHRLPEGFVLPPSFAMGPFHPGALLAPPHQSAAGADEDDDDDDSRPGSRGGMSAASSGGGGGDSQGAPSPSRGVAHNDDDFGSVTSKEGRAPSPVEEAPVAVAAT